MQAGWVGGRGDVQEWMGQVEEWMGLLEVGGRLEERMGLLEVGGVDGAAGGGILRGGRGALGWDAIE